jgi:hypothetical protein
MQSESVNSDKRDKGRERIKERWISIAHKAIMKRAKKQNKNKKEQKAMILWRSQ